MSEIEIGAGADLEIDRYLEIRVDAFRREAPATYSKAEIETLLQRNEASGIRAMIASNQFVVARCQGAVIGIAGWRNVNLYNLYVHPDHMRRGIGSSLLNEIERRFVATSEHNIFYVDAGLYTRPFYESQGYTVTSIATSSDGLQYLEMNKKLR